MNNIVLSILIAIDFNINILFDNVVLIKQYLSMDFQNLVYYVQDKIRHGDILHMVIIFIF